jgi:glycosyltransferase involved in cell wall biosynthesis
MEKKSTLFVQIPCLNEDRSVVKVINRIPKKELTKLGVTTKIVVIDDGSKDNTYKVASKNADVVIVHKKTLGLAQTFKSGIDYALDKKADIIVNIDADNQYNPSEIIDLIQPILKDEADFVIGDRQIEKLFFMPLGNRLGNRLGSWVIRKLTGLNIPDASSGFRAFNRATALNFNLQSTYTYTHETIIQASEKKLRIVSVPITFRKREFGESRLISGLFNHIKKSMVVIVKTILMYRAFKYLLLLGSIIILFGTLLGIRFLYFFSSGDGTGHTQSLVLASVLVNLGFITIVLGIIADLISTNRKTLEEIGIKLKNL